MTASNPPRVATALLHWMGPRDEALIGDLLEEYGAGRSGWWYWRQALAAIVINVATTVRSHKILTIRAIVLGWLVIWLYTRHVASWVLVGAHTVFGFKHFLFVTGITDWFWVHNIDLPASVVRAGPDIVTAWAGMFASGWLVGYLHRSQGPALVLTYFATLPLSAAAAILWQIVADGRYAGPPVPGLAAILFLYAYLPALIGGLWAVRPGRDRYQREGPINESQV